MVSIKVLNIHLLCLSDKTTSKNLCDRLKKHLKTNKQEYIRLCVDSINSYETIVEILTASIDNCKYKCIHKNCIPMYMILNND